MFRQLRRQIAETEAERDFLKDKVDQVTGQASQDMDELEQVKATNKCPDAQSLQQYVQSQFSLFGITAEDSILHDTVCNWNSLDTATPTTRAGIEDDIKHRNLTFVVPPTELVAVDAGDAAVAQIWLLVPSKLEVLLSVRHYACRPDLSAKQLHILQDALSKAIQVIVKAKPQDVFAPAIVAIHAIGWLYVRVNRLSDHVERRCALVNMCDELSSWLFSNSIGSTSRTLHNVCTATQGVLKEQCRTMGGMLDIGSDTTAILDSSNSALEPDQALLPDPDMGKVAWYVGNEARIFDRGDVCYVGVDLATGGMVLRFGGDVGIDICLCRRAEQVVDILQWVWNALDSRYVNYV